MFKRGGIFFVGLILCVCPHTAVAALETGVAAFDKGDFRTAYRELRPLAEKGDPKAQYYIGFMYHAGKGVAKDAAEAVRWMRPAAEGGVVEAQWAMAFMPVGIVTESQHESHKSDQVKWLTMAANQGHVEAQRKLVTRYQEGWGVPRDLVRAEMWCHIAELHGEKSCESVPTHQMTQDQRAEAKRLTQEWVAKHPVKTEGSSGKSAQQLIAELDSADYKRKKEIEGTLIRMGDASTAAIVETFRGGTSPHMEFLTGVLCARGTEAASAVPELMRLLNSPPVPHPYYKMYIHSSLACVGKQSPEVLALFMTQLKSTDRSSRAWAAHLLGSFDSREAILALGEALDDPFAREQAAGALMRMGPKAAPAIPALGKALDQKGNYIATATANALKAIGTPEALVELKKHGVE